MSRLIKKKFKIHNQDFPRIEMSEILLSNFYVVFRIRFKVLPRRLRDDKRI